MNILITGIHGFVGNHLVTSLKTHHTIYGLDIVSPPKEGVLRTFGWNELDSLPDVDVVIHLAGKAHDTKNLSDAKVYFEVNLGLTKRICDWFITSSATKLIFFSSVKAAADSVGTSILTEEVLPAPKGPYGESKLAAENYLLDQITYPAATKSENSNLRVIRSPKIREISSMEPETRNLEPSIPPPKDAADSSSLYDSRTGQ